jgi:pimeloyl-ACP methyl ester carboxylesterase
MPSTGANGVEVWFDQEGDGDDVLFISGLADEGACWVDQVAGLKDRYRLTTFDNRGVGRSSTPDGPFQITDFAADSSGPTWSDRRWGAQSRRNSRLRIRTVSAAWC